VQDVSDKIDKKRYNYMDWPSIAVLLGSAHVIEFA
jgi:hypothetical protein